MGAGVGRIVAEVGLIDAAIQFACFVIAAALQTEKFYDISGSLTYILCVLHSFRRGGQSLRQKVNTGLVVAWALRLGTFLLSRVVADGHDKRFNKVRNDPRKFVVFWAFQALWVLITALPVYIINAKRRDVSKQSESVDSADRSTSVSAHKPVGPLDIFGWAVWTMGFVVEVVADKQKAAFRANPANAEKFINVGLWRLAQHPNYFGEISMWWGVYLSCLSELKGPELASIMSPFFVSYLLLGVSGVPMLRRINTKRNT
eukprot:gnl/TRDRNA2_/TRDRNA2_129157_c0_seq2.p1 gnl/TRDRNA2_/TRDRNA2_129157_c0~~gnl/TRDRNA2_/TRDRNA2_129157_c0_seq2.p1  ORF type:complete len:259 (+),score=30.58 gnl/TRDRNA2_/TRDRNA2_129157_c0_seq2:34-810(+)